MATHTSGKTNWMIHRPIAFSGVKVARLKKVPIAMKPEMRKTTKLDILKLQRLRAVPSSANWKPTKPLTSKHQYVAVTSPNKIAANHCRQDQSVSTERHAFKRIERTS